VSAAKKRSVRFTLTFGVDIPDDLAALQEVDPDALDAAEDILDDLAYGQRLRHPCGFAP